MTYYKQGRKGGRSRFSGFMFFFAPLVALLVVSCVGMAGESVRERTLLNEGWRFQKDDPEGVVESLNYFKNAAIKEAVLASASGTGLTEAQKDLGKEVPYTSATFDDGQWRKLDLPHDWGIEGPFEQRLPGETGKLPWAGTGWYRKTFTIPPSDAGKRLHLDLDGAMAYSMVWCNGKFVGGWPYGYSSYRLDLTDYIRPGKENVLAIRLNNPDQSSRWYPGSGLYRNVWLVITSPVHVDYCGTYITTPEVASGDAKISLRITLKNSSASEARVTAKTDIYLLDGNGNTSGQAVLEMKSEPVEIAAGQQRNLSSSGTIKNPQLWSLESPALYRAITKVSIGDAVVDSYESTFGIRSIQFTADNGFLLNGKRIQLKGVCNHHDLGALGTAWNMRAAERQLEILKEMGVNALRTSHNMPAPELLDLCDRMGILVMDETFDCWKLGKKKNDYSQLCDDWHEKDLRALIRRDSNHPSVILWSIGNEVMELGMQDQGPAIAASLTAIAKDMDPTRPTVLGSNRGAASSNGVQKAVGVMGQNYEIGQYGKFRRENPTIPLVGSETSSCLSSRGEYFFQTPEMAAAYVASEAKKAAEKGKPAPAVPPYSPVNEDKSQGKSDFQMSSYDLYTPGWGLVPDNEFKSLEMNPHVAGEFVWTGFDYLGEPTPYNGDATNLLNFHDAEGKAEMERQLKELGKIQVPSRSSYFGIVDLAGFKKDRFYLYQAHWRPELPVAHILPHWTWPERVGQVTPVHVYTSGDEAELFLNGQSLGRIKKKQYEYRLRWNDVVYQPGELKVVAYKEGKPWATEVVKTAGPAAKLAMEVDRPAIRNDGLDLAFVSVRIEDKDGTLVPRSKNLIKFEASGAGEIVATDNGDATSHDSFQSHERKAHNGMALVILRARKGALGDCILKATSESLQATSTTIRVRGR